MAILGIGVYTLHIVPFLLLNLPALVFQQGPFISTLPLNCHFVFVIHVFMSCFELLGQTVTGGPK